jgi:tetratricopeptide (TPR) repeat protein
MAGCNRDDAAMRMNQPGRHDVQPTSMMRTSFAAVALAIPLCAAASLQAQIAVQASSVSTVLDLYAAGRTDEAVRVTASIPNLTQFRVRYILEAPAWIGTGDHAVRRRRAAAAFVLELTRARLESDWRLLRDLVEWTCGDLRAAGPPDDFERAWHDAALALAGRARDRIWLLGEIPYLPGQKPRRMPERSDSPGHLVHVAERLPDSSSIRLEWIMAWTWGRDREPTRNFGAGGIPVVFGRRERQLDALTALRSLVHDPAVGAEASLRVAYLEFILGDYPAAHATAAATASVTPTVQYVAHVIAGRALDQMQQADAARQAYERALAALPAGESASLALAAIRFAGDDRADISTLMDRALVRMRDGDDPWRLFLYGSFRYWPERLRTLRLEATR